MNNETNIPVNEKISDWLIKGGFPLELFAHKELIKDSYSCLKSPLYEDIESGKSREIDVVAEKSTISSDNYYFNLKLLIECKKSEKPLLVLSEGKKKRSIREEIFSARIWPSEFCNDQIIAHLGTVKGLLDKNSDLPLSEHILSGYSLIQAFTNSDEKLYKTIYGLAKAEYYYENEQEDHFKACMKNNDSEEFYPIELIVPILLVDAPLFYVHLNGEDICVEETDWASVTLNLPWYLGSKSARRSNIQIVTKKRFSECLHELNKLSEWLGDPSEIADLIKSHSSGTFE